MDLTLESQAAIISSQVAMNLESEGSGSATHANTETANTETEPFPDAEPFPEYNESECEMLASSIAADKRHEQAWIHALGRAAKQEIRTLHVDPNIIPYIEGDPSHRSQVILEQLRDRLADPRLRHEIRRQFITIVNATLQFNFIIFHQTKELLPLKEIGDAELQLETVLNHVEFMDEMLREQLKSAEQVSYTLESVSLEGTSDYERLCKMSTVFAKTMKKPRLLERQLLALYMDMYEEWIRTPFVRLRNRQILTEQQPSPTRAKLSRRIIIVWELMTRCIESYGTLNLLTLEIKEQYFAPVLGYLCDPPDIWEHCWDQYQALEKDRQQTEQSRAASREDI
ncbi:uncharacterized protein N7518_007255 [Penicillium psychrosexuale]|uniref:uncharacterized protein n=1 Tax=Penicillium psychrosexuale TaxID=1002107 RepID=UPI002545B465|nr:uncharacterized protein N7518_007255 [Penicillium psychrosexuale]KAJ5790244.1 hypothetical protein N7518_007255 [Penicillium psychrosexuale]